MDIQIHADINLQKHLNINCFAFKIIKPECFCLSGIGIVVMRSAWDGEIAGSSPVFPIMALWLQTQAVHLSDGIAVGVFRKV